MCMHTDHADKTVEQNFEGISLTGEVGMIFTSRLHHDFKVVNIEPFTLVEYGSGTADDVAAMRSQRPCAGAWQSVLGHAKSESVFEPRGMRSGLTPEATIDLTSAGMRGNQDERAVKLRSIL
ncbi:hypothetical protein EVAR_50686_1 [Eumeta japonica]|uniref:Uncharacterized protein n=1 Tax=Eumeta variegata TaxID=151549 RepID=A0A4C1XPR9_EUMVA|nr:hypothetical protein EVAR_50686_1 [Eumeta japonica]